MAQLNSILVIKLSALGDFILSIASFQAIRETHPSAKITLLTTAPYRRLAEASGCFDEVWLDDRPRWSRPDLWFRLRKKLQSAGFDRVYDLQRSDRSGLYFKLFGASKPEWVGIAPGASHRYAPPRDKVVHIVERETAQLALAGVHRHDVPDLSFIRANLERLQLPERYALLVPGGSAHRPEKRWPAKQFAKLATALAMRGVTPLLIGRDEERREIDIIRRACPKARDLCGDTGLEDLAVMARQAVLAVGNDTGPMHLIAAAGAPSVVLFSSASNPQKVSPRGTWVQICQCDNLADLALGEVIPLLPEDIRALLSS